MNHIQMFIQAMIDSGISNPPNQIIPDGKIHRFSVSNNPKKRPGWYVYHDVEFPYGAFGDYSKCIEGKWSSKNEKHCLRSVRQNAMPPAKNINCEPKQQQEFQRQTKAALKARNLWLEAIDITCTKNSYLARKGIKPYAIKQSDSALIVPMYKDNEIQSIQYIYSNGTKKFMTGGVTSGCHLYLGNLNDLIYLCEGYATGASIHEATDQCVVIAFSAANLIKVASEVRKKYPDIRIVICADLDKSKAGEIAALKTAEQYNCEVILPDFGESKSDEDTDFNDVHLKLGIEKLKLMIESAKSIFSKGTTTLNLNSESNFIWDKPSDLITKAQATPYPIESMPTDLRRAIEEVVDFVQCPISLAASSALSALSLSCQHLANVKRAESLISPVSLYFLAIAESGERKSTVDNYFTKQIGIWQNDKHSSLSREIIQYDSDLQSWTMEVDGIKQKIKENSRDGKSIDELKQRLLKAKENKPKAVIKPKLTFSDVTYEELARNLGCLWPSAGVFSSEAGVIFGGHSMKNEHLMRYLSMLNTFWDGKEVQFDRKTSESFIIRNARLSIGLAVQPETLNRFINSTNSLARNIGFLARFLITWPDSTQGKRFFKEPPKLWPALSIFHDRINHLLNKNFESYVENEIVFDELSLSNTAKREWTAFHDAVELSINKNHDNFDLKDFASKASDNVARLAALFHLFEKRESEIQEDHIIFASNIIEWHLNETKRYFCLNTAIETNETNPLIKLDQFIVNFFESHSKVLFKSYLLQYGPIRNASILNPLLDELVCLNRIKISDYGNSKAVALNPRLMN